MSGALLWRRPASVDDEYVDAAGDRGCVGVEGHGAGVRAVLVRNDVDLQPVAPHLELVDGSGAERISGRQQHVFVHRLVVLGELGDARCLAGSVYANDHQHEGLGRDIRLVVPVPDGGVLRVEQDRHLLLEHFDDVIGVRGPFRPDAVADGVDER